VDVEGFQLSDAVVLVPVVGVVDVVVVGVGRQR